MHRKYSSLDDFLCQFYKIVDETFMLSKDAARYMARISDKRNDEVKNGAFTSKAYLVYA